MPAEGRENPLLKKGNSDAFFREKYLTKNNHMSAMDVRKSVIAVQSIPNMITMQKQHKGSMRNCFQIPGQV